MSDSARTGLTADIVAASTALAVGASTTAVVIDVGDAETFGLDWVITSGAAIAVQVQIRASNSSTGPWDYPASIRSTTFTTTTTISDGTNATDIALCPARYIQVILVNNGTASATITRMTLYKY